MSVDAVVSVAPTVPGLAAPVVNPVVGQLDPVVATDLSRPLRGLVSFVLVLASGALVLRLRRNDVNKAIDAISDSPAVSVIYGVAGYMIVGIVVLYGATTLARLSLAGGILVRTGVIISTVFALLLTGFGFLVVGTLLTDIFDSRRPAYGLLIGASLSAVTWLLFSPTGSVVASLAIAAFGIGGSVRVWIHSERTVKTEIEAR
ncbi:hypothetical protein Har1130_15460 [Haloarcula sp. CBA1130]|uniref:hypothetical protein n=1 Tax=unclassified Haloarcula TaxID=2624677 RepID=UPI0012475A17|nr:MULTISPECIES: hypothetical protein [unclassified Haloarcula]KAA9395898.1 hypothetical protein Har1129_18460 [Haloarcula sp. CBA1129]KAA9400173.1 hypothetical protein Har1130_15460 [Haloarcula sp. CBA1130]